MNQSCLPSRVPALIGRRWTLVPLAMLFAGSMLGCQGLSKAAYHCGRALDPATYACRGMGLGPHGAMASGDVVPAQFTAVAAEESAQLRAEAVRLNQELEDVHHRLDQVAAEGAQRNEALIAARAELGRLQAEVAALKGDLHQWQGDLEGFRRTFQARGEEQLSNMREFANAIELLDQRFQQSLAIGPIP